MSVEKQEKILEMVRRQLGRSNPPGTEALYGRAARIDDGVKELTLRQFNARYPLRVRREMAREEEAGDEDTVQQEADQQAPQADRGAIRSILLEFAREVVETPEGPAFVDLITSEVDGYVERIEKGAAAEP